MNNLFSAEIYKERVNWKLSAAAQRGREKGIYSSPRAREVSVAVLFDGVFVFSGLCARSFSTAQMNMY